MPEPHYPLRIRFWYLVHDGAKRLCYRVWRTKLGPWHHTKDAPPVPPNYYLIQTIPATPEDQAHGVTERRIYATRERR